jgi:hypothetical protein
MNCQGLALSGRASEKIWSCFANFVPFPLWYILVGFMVFERKKGKYLHSMTKL